MKFYRDPHHTIDFIFPLAVFFVFAVSAFAVLVLSAHAYASQTARSNSSYGSQMPLSYVREKLRQNDGAESLSVGELDGADCLILKTASSEVSGDAGRCGYLTYIYASDGMLKELIIREDVTAQADAGREILPVSSFTAEETADGLFFITCQTEDEETQSMTFAERSFHR